MKMIQAQFKMVDKLKLEAAELQVTGYVCCFLSFKTVIRDIVTYSYYDLFRQVLLSPE